MPYTRSLLEEELKKGNRLQTVLPWRLFTLSAVIFAATIFVVLGMNFGYSPYLDSQIKQVDAEIESLSQSVSGEEKQALVNFYSQLTNVNSLLGSRTKASGVLSFLERNTHKQVYYVSLAFDARNRELRVSGAASSFGVLAEQLNLYQRAEEIESASLDSSQFDREIKGVRFEARLRLKTEALKQT